MIKQLFNSIIESFQKALNSTKDYVGNRLLRFNSQLFLKNIADLGHAFWAPVVFFFIDLPLLFDKKIAKNPWWIISIPLYLIAAFFTAIFSVLVALMYITTSLLSWMFFGTTPNLTYYLFQGLKLLFNTFLSVFNHDQKKALDLLKFPWIDTTELRLLLGEELGDSQLAEVVNFLNSALNAQPSNGTTTAFDYIDKLVCNDATPADFKEALNVIFHIKDYYQQNPNPIVYELMKKIIAFFLTNQARSSSYDEISQTLDGFFERFSDCQSLDKSCLRCITPDCTKLIIDNKERIAPLVSFFTLKALNYDALSPTLELAKEIEFVKKTIATYLESASPTVLAQLCHQLSSEEMLPTTLVAHLIFHPKLMALKQEWGQVDRLSLTENELESMGLPDAAQVIFHELISTYDRNNLQAIDKVPLEYFVNHKIIDVLSNNKKQAGDFLAKFFEIAFPEKKLTALEKQNLSSLIVKTLEHKESVIKVLTSVAMLKRTNEMSAEDVASRVGSHGPVASLYNQQMNDRSFAFQLIDGCYSLLTNSPDFRTVLTMNKSVLADIAVSSLNIPTQETTGDLTHPSREEISQVIDAIIAIDNSDFLRKTLSLFAQHDIESQRHEDNWSAQCTQVLGDLLRHRPSLPAGDALARIISCFYSSFIPVLPEPQQQIMSSLAALVTPEMKNELIAISDNHELSTDLGEILKRGNSQTLVKEVLDLSLNATEILAFVKNNADSIVTTSTILETTIVEHQPQAAQFFEKMNRLNNVQKSEIIKQSVDLISKLTHDSKRALADLITQREMTNKISAALAIATQPDTESGSTLLNTLLTLPAPAAQAAENNQEQQPSLQEPAFLVTALNAYAAVDPTQAESINKVLSLQPASKTLLKDVAVNIVNGLSTEDHGNLAEAVTAESNAQRVVPVLNIIKRHGEQLKELFNSTDAEETVAHQAVNELVTIVHREFLTPSPEINATIAKLRLFSNCDRAKQKELILAGIDLIAGLDLDTAAIPIQELVSVLSSTPIDLGAAIEKLGQILRSNPEFDQSLVTTLIKKAAAIIKDYSFESSSTIAIKPILRAAREYLFNQRADGSFILNDQQVKIILKETLSLAGLPTAIQSSLEEIIERLSVEKISVLLSNETVCDAIDKAASDPKNAYATAKLVSILTNEMSTEIAQAYPKFSWIPRTALSLSAGAATLVGSYVAQSSIMSYMSPKGNGVNHTAVTDTTAQWFNTSSILSPVAGLFFGSSKPQDRAQVAAAFTPS